MKTYYMVTANLTFFINIEEGKIPFYQELAENLMNNRGFGSDQYNFTMTNKKRSQGIDLTQAYINLYLEFYNESALEIRVYQVKEDTSWSKKGSWCFENILTNIYPNSCDTYQFNASKESAWNSFIRYLNSSTNTLK